MQPPALVGIHHVKFPVSDLARSRAWYERVFDLRAVLEFADEEDGVVRGIAYEIPGLPEVGVALRENPAAARGITGFDPVSFAIADRDAAQAWADRLDELGIPHSPVIDATGCSSSMTPTAPRSTSTAWSGTASTRPAAPAPAAGSTRTPARGTEAPVDHRRGAARHPRDLVDRAAHEPHDAGHDQPDRGKDQHDDRDPGVHVRHLGHHRGAHALAHVGQRVHEREHLEPPEARQ